MNAASSHGEDRKFMAGRAHIRRVCTLSADTTVLETIENAAGQAGLQHPAAADCAACNEPCASIVAVDASRPDFENVLARIPREPSSVVMAILPSDMPVEIPRRFGIEVVVYRELMQQFLFKALRLSVSLLELADSRRKHVAVSAARIA
jgi:hypothetical protein